LVLQQSRFQACQAKSSFRTKKANTRALFLIPEDALFHGWFFKTLRTKPFCYSFMEIIIAFEMIASKLEDVRATLFNKAPRRHTQGALQKSRGI
jgi:hypothetical protein